jgi:3-oxoacyl-[acyl-carrier-protein] synthase III
MRPFVVNRHGHLVFPSSYLPDLDFSVFETLAQFDEVVQRDFEAKAPTATVIVERIEANGYHTRFDLLRDLGLHLFWVNRYSLSMYEKRPTRWRDVPRHRDDVFIPVVSPWPDAAEKVAAVAAGYDALPPAWDDQVEDRIYGLMFDVFENKQHLGKELPPIKPTVAEIQQDPGNLTFVMSTYDPDYRVYSDDEILDYREDVAELESLGRWAMVLHNQYPWDRTNTNLIEIAKVNDDDFVVVFHPRDSEVRSFIRRTKSASRRPDRIGTAINTQAPVRPYPAIEVRKRFEVMPRLEALAVVKGEHACTNDDVIRNSAYNWSPMSAVEIAAKTGIEQRMYTERSLAEIGLDAAKAALAKAGRNPEEIGAVLVCTCTSGRLIPSVAAWISGQLGIGQTHASFDLIAACAGLAYGLAEAIRQLQEVERPVLLVCAEKFSDKIGSVRTSRMIFGDGAAALIVGPSPAGAAPDIEVVQTYAGGPVSQVNSIIWPNPAFDNNLTVYGPEVKALAQRYLEQMMDELKSLPAPEGDGSLLSTVELVVPHQANKTMVMALAQAAGFSGAQLYFNIERVGNVSAASIPIAIFDAVIDGVIARPTRIFAPGFGAGAVGGYAVMRIDPAIVAPANGSGHEPMWADQPARATSSEDVRVAFGD